MKNENLLLNVVLLCIQLRSSPVLPVSLSYCSL